MNIFIYIDYLDNLALECIQKELDCGNDVVAMICDSSLGICKANYCKSQCICYLCSKIIENATKQLTNTEKLKLVHFSDYLTSDIIDKAKSLNFEYNNVKSLKELVYKDVEIGYAAFSSYVSNTRNITPNFNSYFHSMIDDYLRSEVIIYELMISLIGKENFDKFIIHNGRHSNLKPFYRVAELNNIDFILTERQWSKSGYDLVNNFNNTYPHSPRGLFEKMSRRWSRGDESKYVVAKSFYENRRYGRFSGDQNYIKNQNANELPEGFDKTKRNFVIFNSSEDEYFSINKEFDESGLYPDQYTALHSLFEHYKDDSSIHFYLRIHPNLGEVPFPSHTNLYNLKYNNVTIIPPFSPISSYALMESCEKVITFISTMTVESAYWGKPVIALNHFYYSFMNIAYEPNSEIEFFNLIDTPNLQCKKNDNCLKAAYYYMNGSTEPLRFFPTHKKRYTYGPVIIEDFSLFKFCGSSKLLAFILKALRIMGHIGLIGKYDHIAKKTK